MKNRPNLRPHLTPVFSAFKALGEGRSYGSMTTSNSAGQPVQILRPFPITFEAIDRYATRYGITTLEEFEEFSYYIRVLDQFYIDYACSSMG